MRNDAPVWPIALALGGGGVLYGFVVAVLAVFMAGAGHGWGEGLFSSVAILLVPLAGVAWAYRRQLAGPALAGLAMVPAVYVDWFLCSYTSYVDRVWRYMPGVLVPWAVLWIAWQVLGVWVLLSKLINRP